MKITQSCLILCDPVDCSPPGSSVYGILQARILKRAAIPSPGDLQVSCIASRFFTIWATKEAPAIQACQLSIYYLSASNLPFFAPLYDNGTRVLNASPSPALERATEWPYHITMCAAVLSNSAVSDSLQPHGLQPIRQLCPSNFPGKNTGVSCHFPIPGDLPNVGIEPVSLESPILAGRFYVSMPPSSREILPLWILVLYYYY